MPGAMLVNHCLSCMKLAGALARVPIHISKAMQGTYQGHPWYSHGLYPRKTLIPESKRLRDARLDFYFQLRGNEHQHSLEQDAKLTRAPSSRAQACNQNCRPFYLQDNRKRGGPKWNSIKTICGGHALLVLGESLNASARIRILDQSPQF